MAPRQTRFLLIEDDDDHAELVSLAMARLGDLCVIDRVSDGEAALDFLHRRGRYSGVLTPDVILMDLNMPRMGGLELLDQIKCEGPLRVIPVVVLTTSDAESDRAHAYLSSVNSYVVKPLEFDQFRDMIEDLGRYWSTWNRPPSLAS